GVKVNSGGFLFGDGGLLSVTDNGSFDMSANNASATLRAATTGTYAGVTVFEARVDGNTSKLALNGSIDIKGTLNFPSALFNLTSGGAEVGVRVIAWQMQCSGSGGIR